VIYIFLLIWFYSKMVTCLHWNFWPLWDRCGTWDPSSSCACSPPYCTPKSWEHWDMMNLAQLESNSRIVWPEVNGVQGWLLALPCHRHMATVRRMSNMFGRASATSCHVISSKDVSWTPGKIKSFAWSASYFNTCITGLPKLTVSHSCWK